MTDRPALFPPDYAQPIDTSTLITRWPGIDAPCHCGNDPCRWPFHPQCWQLTEPESEDT